jgi:hypothetical protein
MRAILLATLALATTASAALADPSASTAGRVGPAASAATFAPPAASPAGPVELSDGQMDKVTAGGTRTASSPTTRVST